MASPPSGLDRIRIQTARMLEIYALVQNELGKNKHLALSVEGRAQLHQAVLTIEANMRQLQAYMAACREENSPEAAGDQGLEVILDTVLKWTHDKGE
jgi:hypothetical protein